MSTWCSFERSRSEGYYGQCGATTIYLSPTFFHEKNASESPDDIWSNQWFLEQSDHHQQQLRGKDFPPFGNCDMKVAIKQILLQWTSSLN